MRTRIKICCIATVAEAQLAIAYGADALGLVSAMPSGPGPITDERIAEVARAIPPPIASCLLTCRQEAASVIAQQRAAGVNTLQLVDSFPLDQYATLRAALPRIAIVQVIHVTGPESITEALEVSQHVDALLLDSGNQTLAIKELGGTGRTHDWAISREIRERIAIPLFLAGGLNPDNVGEAIRQVRPFGVDICGGVRTNGRLDPDKLGRFVHAVHGGAVAGGW